MLIKEKILSLKQKTVPLYLFLLTSTSLVILFLAIVSVQKPQNSQTNAQALASNTAPITQVLIVLSDQGFYPASVTIQKGSSIKWVNQSNNIASVNSDNYPTNRLYPELNLGQFKKNMALVRVFSKSGTYTYHNQYNPKQTGIVVVE